MTGHSSFTLPDGAKLAYEVLGSQHLGMTIPIVLIPGATARRGDWERLATSLKKDRAVLLFDHRGIGDSTLTPGGDEIMTIEMLARDIVHLLDHLEWRELALCGFSMGGTIAQQILFLPYHPTNPTQLPFRPTFVFLTATMTSVLKDKRYGLKVNTTVPDKPRTLEEKKEITRPIVESTFDPQWLKDSANEGRLNWWIDRSVVGRPARTIMKQAQAMSQFNFSGLHSKLPTSIKLLVIHGEVDSVVPFSYGQEIMEKLPQAKFVEIGSNPGQIPHLQFGHHWFEYFDIKVWHEVITRFMQEPTGEKRVKANL